jgi:putative flippase GtrA
MLDSLLTKSMLYKFIKFGIVGFSGVFIDFGITYLLREKVKIQQFVANAIGFCCAATSNYFLNRVWTYHSQNPQVAIEFGNFFLISLMGLGINTLILWFLVKKMDWNFYFSKLLAVGVVTIWNFVINTLYTFS